MAVDDVLEGATDPASPLTVTKCIEQLVSDSPQFTCQSLRQRQVEAVIGGCTPHPLIPLLEGIALFLGLQALVILDADQQRFQLTARGQHDAFTVRGDTVDQCGNAELHFTDAHGWVHCLPHMELYYPDNQDNWGAGRPANVNTLRGRHSRLGQETCPARCRDDSMAEMLVHRACYYPAAQICNLSAW